MNKTTNVLQITSQHVKHILYFTLNQLQNVQCSAELPTPMRKTLQVVTTATSSFQIPVVVLRTSNKNFTGCDV